MTLSEVQQAMYTDITSSGTGQRGSLDYVAPTSRLSRQQCLSVYQEAYTARLVEVLEKEFPYVVLFLGVGAFEVVARDFLDRYPPTAYTLAELGLHFPEYLATAALAPENQAHEIRNMWTCLTDLSKLERVFMEVFTSLEKEPVREMSFCFPVQRFFYEPDLAASGCIPSPHPVTLRIFREHYIVHIRVLSG